ncbi:MAG: hypothetical protein ACR2MS_07380 [Weeksellaceae bacterium]
MVLLVANKILRKNVMAMALYPFILLRDGEMKLNTRLINHERIHLRQQLELLIVPFYFWYLIEYLFRLIQYKDGHLAYLNISFEREAYANEYDMNYLKKRKLFSFLKFI